MLRRGNEFHTEAEVVIALAVILLGAVAIAATAPVIDKAAYVISYVMTAVLTVVIYYFGHHFWRRF